jgi:hypothetical protein
VSSTSSIPYNPFDQLHFDLDRCFIDGTAIDPRTDLIPVFPSWLQQRYGLENKSITLLTGEKITYSELLIPVGSQAQKAGIDYLQRAVGDLLGAGFEAFKWLKPAMLYQWLNWVFLGITYYEIRACLRNKTMRNAFLVQQSYLSRYKLLHLALTGAIRPVEFMNFDPGSVFVLQCHSYENASAGYDLKVSANTLTMSIRMGELGIMASLLDNGTQMSFFEKYFRQFDGTVLHPIQFDELFAKISYKTWLMNPVFDYGIAWPDADDPTTFVTLRIEESHKEEEAFRPWEDSVYGTVLQSYLLPYGFPAEEVYNKTGQVITFLEKPGGGIRHFDALFNEIT